jgi:hypothetical protein
MLYGNYRFRCRFESDAELPAYKGSTLRGVFGHALKRVVCALKRQDCPGCILRERCLYTRVFETALSQGGKDRARNSVIPHPFVIEPPLETKTNYQKLDLFECGLILFGEVNHMLPYFVYAFEQMGEIGLGRRIKERRGRFTLQEMKCGGDAIYSNFDGKLKAVDVTENLKNTFPTGQEKTASYARVCLETPLRFKREGRLSDGLPFHVLVRNMLRRTSALFGAYGGGEPQLDYKGMVKRAYEIEVEASNLRWADWERFSNRQDRAMNLGGITGTVIYRGKLGEFLPLFELSSKIHIGKQTSFGLGQMGFEVKENPPVAEFQITASDIGSST